MLDFNTRLELNNYLSPMKEEIEILLQALESGQIRILNVHEYFMETELSQELQNIRQSSKRNSKKESIRSKRKWWKFW